MNRDSWNIMKLGEICNILNGYAFNSKYFTDNTNAMPLIRIRDIKRGYTETFYTGIYNESYIVKKGDYIIGMDGEFNICQWESTNALLNQRVCKIWPRDTKSTHIRYIYYFLSSLLKKIEEKTAFVTVKHLSTKQLNSSDITIPVFFLQKQIVKELDTLSDIITKKKEQLAELDKLAQATFHNMFGDPIKNEKHWETKKLESICSSVVRGPFGSALKKDFFVQKSEFTYKVYEQKHAIQKDAFIGQYYIDELLYNSLKRFTVLPKDIIMSCSGTIGEFFEIPANAERGIINQALLKFTLLENKIISVFFLFLMKQLIINVEKKGSGIQNIGSVKFIKDITLGLPPISLQNQFAEKIEAIEQQKALINQSITDTQLLFDYTMDKYFN
ncbi:MULTISPECIES: restriction endonuclease subunit S [Snodgrassella]|uniref:restriction endonuclease subunit S n=1 Tax=Snodgrassella TaxID=1193515 RepID=UPI0009FF7DF7|nr:MULTISPECIES: restriction endonuclease subunit S [Snodgrassella]MBI0128840.1 restriction endonuclease subunit S [Snodgrassella sp. W8124]MBI0158444.1 restriction endonuclease subunit S [Snodgrassella sp. W6238H11]MBI0160969.1 restriction endonuclease subunit S [Snodgrassella sp. W6238H14]ORF26980.1 hypothetical protein BGI08_10895 [Snodgrassella alvi]